MAEKRKDLPAKSDVNPDTDHDRYRQQEEYDNKGTNDQEKISEARNKRHTEEMRDSQQGDERMLPETKKRESPRDYKEERRFPNTKK